MAMLGHGDDDHPGLYGLGFEGFRVSVGTYLDINSIEAEVTINATEDTPAILGRLGGCEALFKVLDGDVRVEKASEGSIDKQPACDAELNVAEVLDTDPRGEAKGRNDQALVVLSWQTINEKAAASAAQAYMTSATFLGVKPRFRSR